MAEPEAADVAEVLVANRAFYAALESRDASRMDTIWSHDDDVACTHPGWHRLDGWDDVSRSWHAIFSSSRAWKVRSEDERAFVSGEIAVVLCTEILAAVGAPGEPARMQATNVFRRERGAWRIVHHHASGTPDPEGDEGEDAVN